ncbi:solute carrier family 17 member 9-like isoform X2 [Limulus polyphemus]|nr:solute carrier family 17 member 9-like isoform X2 [Limulus polyphemus]XP_022247824.1 solute carrier family 17 member 9-like isoform X2 [Limulus polyphemus]
MNPVKNEKNEGQSYWTQSERYLWLAVLFSGTSILYFARVAMPITMPTVAREYSWNKVDSGIILSCFFWGYALTQVPGGNLSDSMGGDYVLFVAAIGWSLLTFCTPDLIHIFGGPIGVIWPIVLGRSILGLCQGVHFPSVSSLLSKKLRTAEKTFFLSFVFTGAPVGMLLNGSLGSYMLNRFGWQSVFRCAGVLGLTWAVVLRYIMLTYKKASSSKECEDGKIEIESKVPVMKNSVPWGILFQSPAFWCMLFAHFAETNTFFIMMSWLPIYFSEVFPGGKGWIFNVVPWIICPVFGLIGGWVAQQLIIKGWGITLVRKLFEGCGLYPTSLLLILIGYQSSYIGALVSLAVAMGLTKLTLSGVVANPLDIAPTCAGTVYGMMNTMGAIPGFLGVYITGYILEIFQSWKMVFNFTACLNIIFCSFFLIFGTAKPIVPMSGVS